MELNFYRKRGKQSIEFKSVRYILNGIVRHLEVIVKIFYHANCRDGLGAAAVAYSVFGEEAEYFDLSHDVESIEELVSKEEEVLFLDISPKKEWYSMLRDKNVMWVVIDHHITAYQEAMEVLNAVEKARYIYTNEHSGSVMAWKVLRKNEEVPQILLHIEDRDLWRLNLQNTLEICEGINVKDVSFKTLLDQDLDTLYQRGSVVLAKKIASAKKSAETKRKVLFEDIDAYVVFSNGLSTEISDVIFKEQDEVDLVLCCRIKDDKLLVELRSRNDVDCSLIAKKYNGGGHKYASGFTMPVSQALSVF